ncbi:MAG: hypothetical protein KC545_14020, partial [Nitrospira sp.]|nr:hypothetical protein [Nitrospira sp.]
DRVNGLLVPPSQAPLLEVAIGTLIQHPEFRHRLGRQARQHIEEHFHAARNNQTIFSLLTKTFPCRTVAS